MNQEDFEKLSVSEVKILNGHEDNEIATESWRAGYIFLKDKIQAMTNTMDNGDFIDEIIELSNNELDSFSDVSFAESCPRCNSEAVGFESSSEHIEIGECFDCEYNWRVEHEAVNPNLRMSIDDLINKFKDGKERYLKSAQLNVVVNSLFHGGDMISVIDQLLLNMDSLQADYEKLINENGR